MLWDLYTVQIKETGRSCMPAGTQKDGAWWPCFEGDDFDLIYLIQGHCRFQLSRGWVRGGPGTCLLLRPGVRYHIEKPRRVSLVNYFAHFSLIDRCGRVVQPSEDLPPELLQPPDVEMLGINFRRIVELTFGFDAHGYVLPPCGSLGARIGSQLLQGLLMDLHLGEGTAVESRTRRLIRDAAGHIMEAPSGTRHVDALVRELGYSKDHVARLFRRETGYSPLKFIINARIQTAKRLLYLSPKPIAEIADLLGYRDVAFFSRQFHRETGQSPTQYRQRVRPSR